MNTLSAYPTDSYFDPNRPPWLPYWVDSPTESGLKWGYYPGAAGTFPDPVIPPPPPGPPADQLKTWTPDDAAKRARLAWEAWKRNAIPGQPPGDTSDTAVWLYAAIALAGVSALLLWRK